MNENEFAELAAGHALNALSSADAQAFAQALGSHPEWAHLAAVDVDTVAALSDAVPPVAPPPAIRASLLARIAETPQISRDEALPVLDGAPEIVGSDTSGDDDDVAGFTRGGWGARRWFTLAASVAVLLGLGFGAVVVGQQLAPPASVVALEQIEQADDAQSATVSLDDGGTATAHWSASLGEAVLVSDGLPTLASDQTFELWFVRADGAIAAGTFDASDGAATAALVGEMHAGDVIAVTIEPSGGSPDGIPTSDPIIVIPTEA